MGKKGKRRNGEKDKGGIGYRLLGKTVFSILNFGL
jgi:hypothetical protein